MQSMNLVEKLFYKTVFRVDCTTPLRRLPRPCGAIWAAIFEGKIDDAIVRARQTMEEIAGK
jgi:hypothetical protein